MTTSIKPSRPTTADIAERLAELYHEAFGGKDKGRYRISVKQAKRIAKRSRLSSELLREVADELYERGYLLLDLETFFVVLSAKTFKNYRRVGDACFNDSEPARASVVEEADE